MSEIWVVVEHLRGQLTETTGLMLAAARSLAEAAGGLVTALLLGHEVGGLTGRLGKADRVLGLDHPSLAGFNPDAWLEAVCAVLPDPRPRAVLFGHTTMGMDLACGVSQRLGLPMVAQCRRLEMEEGRPVFRGLTCAGRLTASGPLPEPACVVSIMPGGYKPEEGLVEGSPPVEMLPAPAALEQARTRLRGWIEPESGDVDIAAETILVSVGRGLQQQDNLHLANDLAEALGGVVSASRPVVDQGWLPTSRLVGKSGKSVKPKLYLAVGISGAPEHLEGVAGFETMVAINTDEAAPIFDVATHGAAVDALELLPLLTEKVRQAR
jgi:electron transfer flavoprotein alpha subunit